VTRLVRLLLACLLIAALPLQGIAAASMAFCATGAPSSGAAAAPHGHDHAATHEHAAAQQAGAALPDTAHACSVCMACCHAVGLVATAEFNVPSPEPQGPIAAVVPLLHERPASVLERPPRA
jgi:hypothetical protein